MPSPSPTLVVQPALGLRVWEQRSRGMPRPHLHQDLEFNFILEGSMQYLIGGALVSIPKGRLGVIWGAMPHQSIPSDPPPEVYLVTLPLEQAMLWSLPERFVRRLLQSGLVIDPRPNDGDLSTFRQWEDDLRAKSEPRRQLVREEIARRLHRLALNVFEADEEAPADPPCPRPSSSDALLAAQQMAQVIGRRFGEPLSVGQIAEEVSLHPNYAMTLFRRQTGMTINAYLTRRRIAHAQSLLATTTLPILQIAQECGFGSVSRFYEAFQKEAGCAPRQFRRRMARPALTSPPGPP
jgi:AraC-like DNA-binding protein